MEVGPRFRNREPTRERAISSGMCVVPDVRDDKSWDSIVNRGFPYYEEWTSVVYRPGETRPFALSYKHTEHDFGKLSVGQANELRALLRSAVGVGKAKAILWVDSIHMMRESLGMQDFSNAWLHTGLVPYENLPVLRLETEWDRKHEASGKRSGWLWLERELGRHNRGVYTARSGLQRLNTSGGLDIKTALGNWLNESDRFGFRPADERDVRAQLNGTLVFPFFTCPGRNACIEYIFGLGSAPCGGASSQCKEIASKLRGTNYYDDNGDHFIIFNDAGTIAHSVFKVQQTTAHQQGYMHRLPLSKSDLQEYTKLLGQRTYALKSMRFLGLDRFN